MPYQFAKEKRDYSDYASGRVFYSTPGHPAFPVRLTSELFQRCQAIRQKNGLTHPAVLYDPCCGLAYHLSVLAYLHWSEIDTIIGSDIEASILATATRNLNLLTPSGLARRAEEIATMRDQYDKLSHTVALQSVQRLSAQLQKNQLTHQISTYLFEADATNGREIERALAGRQIDIVLADVPYGQYSSWQSPNKSIALSQSFLWHLLDALLTVITDNSVVAIATDKAQTCRHEQYEQVGRFQIGKRRMILLQRS